MVSFCPTCKNMMIPQKKSDGTVMLFCRKCNTEESGKEIKITQKIKHGNTETIVIEDPSMEASVEVECPKCKKVVQAAQWQVQTRSADEASTTFFRCIECSNTWRDYGG